MADKRKHVAHVEIRDHEGTLLAAGRDLEVNSDGTVDVQEIIDAGYHPGDTRTEDQVKRDRGQQGAAGGGSAFARLTGGK